MRRIARVILCLALMAAALWTLAALPAGHGRWFDLANHLLLPVACTTLALLPALAVLRLWRWSAAAALLLAVHAAILLPSAAEPSPGAAQAAEPPLRIVWFNLWHSNRSPEASLDFLRQTRADVLVLSEVTPAWRARLAGLHDLYPHRIDCSDLWRCRVALLSRLPWSSAEATLVEGGTPLVTARLAAAGSAVTVVRPHLARLFPHDEYQLQQAQAEVLARRLAAIAGPLVVVGDFNATPWSPLMRRLAERTDLVLADGLDGTWPAWLPLRLPIDHVLVSRDLAPVLRRVGPSVGSDHRPIIVESPLPPAT